MPTTRSAIAPRNASGSTSIPGVNPGATVAAPTVPSPNRFPTSSPFVGLAGQDVGGFSGLVPTFAPSQRQTAQEGDLFGTLGRQRSLLGPLGQLLPENFILRLADVPALEANLNFQQLLAGVQDRDTGIQRLEQARSNIGISPESTLARELAVQRARGDRPLGDQQIEQGRSAIKQQGALAAQDASRSLAEQFAARGIGGSVPAIQQAALQQSLAADIAGQIADFDLQAAALQEEAQRQAFSDLSNLAFEEELRRTALDQLIADQFLNTQRQAIDLSGLLGVVPNAPVPVGGGLVL